MLINFCQVRNTKICRVECVKHCSITPHATHSPPAEYSANTFGSPAVGWRMVSQHLRCYDVLLGRIFGRRTYHRPQELWRHKRNNLRPVLHQNRDFMNLTFCHWLEWRNSDLGRRMTISDYWNCSLTVRKLSEVTDLVILSYTYL